VTAVVVVLLVVVVASAVVSTLGVLLARDAFDQLHYVGPVAHLGGLALLAAVVVEHGLDRTAARAAVVLLVVQLAAPVATHATARAGMVRGDLARLRDAEQRVVE